MRVLDVFVEGVHAKEDLAADVARDAVRVADQGRVLLENAEVQLQLLKWCKITAFYQM